MANYALVANGTVQNKVVWDGDTETWQPPSGVTAVAIPDGTSVDIGYTYNGTTFSVPT